MNREAFEQATASGRARALDFLKQHGYYTREAVSIFPSITPAATAALVTGATPATHGVPGMCWYDRDAERYVNYGQSPQAALVEGLSQMFFDMAHNLNHRHLSKGVRTIHEQLDALGFTTASINYLVYRGNYPKEPELKPMLEKLLLKGGLELPAVQGPKLHYLADLLPSDVPDCKDLLKDTALDRLKRAKRHLKVSDAWAACVARELVERREADMILLYLHENDHHSHEHGPEAQLDSLAEASEYLQVVFDCYQDWEEMLSEWGVVVAADHSQSPVSEDQALALEDLLGDFSQVERNRNGKEPFEDSDLAVAGNGRVGFVYLHQDRRRKLLPAVVSALLDHPGVDQAMWRDGETYVVESRRGRLLFRSLRGEAGARAGAQVSDERANRFEVEGDLGVVSGVVSGGCLETPEYPLALWRVKEALDQPRSGDVVVTPSLAWQLKDLGGGSHPAGDHASLHAQDSLVPFISTLPSPPVNPLITDVTPHIVSHLRESRKSRNSRKS